MYKRLQTQLQRHEALYGVLNKAVCTPLGTAHLAARCNGQCTPEFRQSTRAENCPSRKTCTSQPRGEDQFYRGLVFCVALASLPSFWEQHKAPGWAAVLDKAADSRTARAPRKTYVTKICYEKQVQSSQQRCRALLRDYSRSTAAK